MKRIALLFGLIFCSSWVLLAQQPVPALASPQDSLVQDSITESRRVKILHADYLTFTKQEDEAIQKLIGKVRMQQDSTLFFCDSAYFYEDKNLVEAFRHVRVVMKDGVILSGDKLTYEGDEKIAKVREKVKLEDGDMTLTTDRITYYRNEKYGYYDGGGTLNDQENTLTSQYGYYYSEEDMAYFKNAVRLENPDYILETDTLGYNTDTEEAFFLTFTTIVSDDGDIETTRGRYDTKNEYIYLVERSTVRDSTYTLISDTLIYADSIDLGRAWGNVVIEQDSSLTILGEYGEFKRRTEESFITDDAIAIQTMEEDTLYMLADTLFYYKEKRLIPPVGFAIADSVVQDSLVSDSMLVDSALVMAPDSIPPGLALPDSMALVDQMQDSIGLIGPPPLDTLEVTIFRAHYNVTFFMNDMQGKADSLVYYYDDSLINLFDDPVLWSDANQLTGDTIKVWMRDNQIDSMWVGADGFLISEEDTVGYNQIKGKELRVKFKDNELKRMHVIGNSESIYFARDDADTINVSYTGMNEASSQQMLMYFADNEPVKIVFLSKPEGTFRPFYEVVGKPNKLDGMQWRITEKPEDPRIFDPTVPALPADGELLPMDEAIPAEIIPQSDTLPAQSSDQKR
ncbi:MAG: OstA-like protein [Bacteroidota bacterium]